MLRTHARPTRGASGSLSDVRLAPRLKAALHPAPTFSGLPNAPPLSEGDGFNFTSYAWPPCKTFKGTSQCGVEWDTWTVVRALVPARATVLELGARFGTTGCVLADVTANSGQVVSVEPDATALPALLHNRLTHRCAFHVVAGTVAEHALAVGPPEGFGGVGTRTHVAANGTRHRMVPNLRVRQVEAQFQLRRRIDTVVVDCEGCSDWVLGDHATGRQLRTQASLIILEEDGLNPLRYTTHTRALLQKSGFAQVWCSLAWWARGTGRSATRHTAWRRPGTGESSNCPRYRRAARLSAQQLTCCGDGDVATVNSVPAY